MDVTIIKPFSHKNLVGKEQEVVDLYYDQMAPMLYIADTYECSCDTLMKWFKANSLKMRSRNESVETRGKFRVEKDVVFGIFKFTHPNLIGKDDEVKEFYLDKQYSLIELCDHYKVPQTGTFTAWMKRNGIIVRNPKESRNIERRYEAQKKSIQYKFTDDEISNILNLYNEGYGCKYIAKSLKIDSCVIFRILEENNIPIRVGTDSHTDKSKKQSIETFIKNYGNYDIANEKRHNTIISNGGYGILNLARNQSIMKKYGVENAMQIPEFFYKQQERSKRLKYANIDGREIVYQGFELLAIYRLLSEGYELKDIKIGKGNVPNFKYFFEDKNRRYYPDIYIPKDNRIVEVKSQWTYERELDKNLAKRDAVLNAGYKFDFYIMEK